MKESLNKNLLMSGMVKQGTTFGCLLLSKSMGVNWLGLAKLREINDEGCLQKSQEIILRMEEARVW